MADYYCTLNDVNTLVPQAPFSSTSKPNEAIVTDMIASVATLIDANISALAIVIGGTVRGNLSASTRVEILPTGVLTGSLKTGSFSAADGASVKGEVWVEPPAPRAAGGSLNS